MRLISRRELRFAQINIFDRCEDIRFFDIPQMFIREY